MTASDPVTPAGPVVDREVIDEGRRLVKAAAELPAEFGDWQARAYKRDRWLVMNAEPLLDLADRCSHLEAALREAEEILHPAGVDEALAASYVPEPTTCPINDALVVIRAALHPGEPR